MKCVGCRVKDPMALLLIQEIIRSFGREREHFIGMPQTFRERRGMPIGNLTSQIFANIYLNELDRFVKHELKVKYYLRYGDDFILIHQDLEKLNALRKRTIGFLENNLKLKLNPKNDKIIKSTYGLKFLGVVI
jgi:RNA-directed DNA polymerase